MEALAALGGSNWSLLEQCLRGGDPRAALLLSSAATLLAFLAAALPRMLAGVKPLPALWLA